ncbi:MAG: LysE family transporter [Firmicutes bacterium]|nr:LysE family transporter [Bacillota bacterium]
MGLGALLISSFFVGLSGAMMPGGLLIVNINETIKGGLIGGLLVITGHALVELLTVTGLALGLGAVLGKETVVGTIAVAGGALLAWMAIGTARSSRTAELSVSPDDSPATTNTRFGPLSAGSLATISNPYWSLWWTSVGAAYVTIAMETGTSALAAFYIGHIASDYAWYFLISLALVTGRRLINRRVYRGMLLVGSIFLAALAVYFIWSGARLLIG